MATDEFYNPYQFLPLDKETYGLSEGLPGKAEFEAKGVAGTRASHAAYSGGEDVFHGRIICRLTLKDPLFIGAGRQRRNKDDSDYMLVEPYTIGGEPAIPAASLRGLISSLAEAASGSALRVLDDKKPVSWRVPAEGGKALSAVGRIVRDSGSGSGMSIMPLAAPTLMINGLTPHSDINRWTRIFGEQLPLKVIFGEHLTVKDNPSNHNISDFEGSIRVEKEDGDLFPDPLSYFYMKALPYCALSDILNSRIASLHERVISVQSKRCRLVFGLKPKWEGGKVVVRTQKYQESHREPGDGFIRGRIRILGAEHRQLPLGKWHETFIPEPEEACDRRLIPLPLAVIRQFEALADERSATQDKSSDVEPNARLPYVPVGQLPFPPQSGRKEAYRVRLRPGQLVYFDVKEDKDWFVVKEVSFSSMWRRLVKRGAKDGEDTRRDTEEDGHIASMWDFFRRELRPYNPARTTISPAEWMFGFVSAGEARDGARGAYAGRVRVSAARLAEPVPAGERNELFLKGGLAPGRADPPGPKYVRLKILAPPKPPCPAMYFHPDSSNQPIAKHKLDVRCEPNGRKVYLHRQGNGEAKPWQTQHNEENKKQKNAIRPLDPKACKEHGGFWFHVDFDNLSRAELDLLCFALSPSSEFRHKLGMGKPIGLGGVHIEPVALMLIDRDVRYGRDVDLLASPRYHALWTDPAAPLPRRWYAREAQAAASEKIDDCRRRADRHRDKLKEPLRQAILLTGDPGALKPGVPVHYPLRSDQRDDEDETFKWFVANANRKVVPSPQALPRIDEKNPKLQPLKKNWVPDKKPRQ